MFFDIEVCKCLTLTSASTLLYFALSFENPILTQKDTYITIKGNKRAKRDRTEEIISALDQSLFTVSS